MNYIDKLEAKRVILKEEILLKEENFINKYNSLFNNNQEDMLERLIRRLSFITSFGSGIRIGISFLNTFLNKK